MKDDVRRYVFIKMSYNLEYQNNCDVIKKVCDV